MWDLGGVNINDGNCLFKSPVAALYAGMVAEVIIKTFSSLLRAPGNCLLRVLGRILLMVFSL